MSFRKYQKIILGEDEIPRVLRNIHMGLVREIRYYKVYVASHRKKLELVSKFVKQWDKAQFRKMKAEIQRVANLIVVGEKLQKKSEVKEKETIKALDEAIEKETDEVAKNNLIEIRQELIELLWIIEKLKVPLLKQSKWFEDNKENIWKEHHKIQDLIVALNEEAQFLFRKGLSGEKGERQILKEIYEYIMPLKYRLKPTKDGKLYKKVTRGMKHDGLLVVPRFSKPYYVKFIFAGKRREIFHQGWSKFDALSRKKIIVDYYDVLKSIRIPVPPKKVFFIRRRGNKGYQVAIKGTPGEDVDAYFKQYYKTREDEVIGIFRQMLEIVHREVRANTKYLVDFAITNFCLDAGGNLIYIDYDPCIMSIEAPWGSPHIMFRMLTLDLGPRKIRETMAQWKPGGPPAFNKRFIFWVTTPEGKFFYIMYTTILAMLEVPEATEFITKLKYTLLKFLRKRRLYKVYDHMVKIFQKREVELYEKPIKQEPLPIISRFG